MWRSVHHESAPLASEGRDDEKEVTVNEALVLDVWVDQEEEMARYAWDDDPFRDKCLKEWGNCLNQLRVNEVRRDHCIFKQLPHPPPWKPDKDPPPYMNERPGIR